MATTKSYADVRDWVLANAGDCADPAQLEVFMENALVEARLVLRDVLGLTERRTVNTVANQATYSLGSGTSRVISLALGPCFLENRGPDCLPDGASAGDGTTGTPERYLSEGSSFTLYPTPDKVHTLSVEALKTTDITLYDLDPSTGDKVWRLVDLPLQAQGFYAQMVLGYSVMDADPARGQMWLNMGKNALDKWRHEGRRTLTNKFQLNRYARPTTTSPFPGMSYGRYRVGIDAPRG